MRGFIGPVYGYDEHLRPIQTPPVHQEVKAGAKPRPSGDGVPQTFRPGGQIGTPLIELGDSILRPLSIKPPEEIAANVAICEACDEYDIRRLPDSSGDYGVCELIEEAIKKRRQSCRDCPATKTREVQAHGGCPLSKF